MRIPNFRDDFLDRFFEEKNLRERYYKVTAPDGTPHTIPTGVVLEHIATTRGQERKQLKEILRKLDYHNADVHDFLEHLAEGIAAQYRGASHMNERKQQLAKLGSLRQSGTQEVEFGPDRLQRQAYPGSGSSGQTGGSPRDPDNKAKVAEIKKALDRAGLWRDINWQFHKYSEFDNYQVGWTADEVGGELVMVDISWEWNEREYSAWVDPMEGSMQATNAKDLSRVVRWLKKNLQPYMSMK